MRTSVVVLLPSMILAVIISGCGRDYEQIRTGDGSVSVPKCTPLVRYSGNSFTIQGIEIPISTGLTVKVGGVTWDTKVLQTATSVTQILDSHRMYTCQMLPALATGTNRQQYQKSLLDMTQDEVRITQLALLVAGGYTNAVTKWIDAYADRASAISDQSAAEKSSRLNLLSPSTAHPKRNALVSMDDLLQ